MDAQRPALMSTHFQFLPVSRVRALRVAGLMPAAAGALAAAVAAARVALRVVGLTVGGAGALAVAVAAAGAWALRVAGPMAGAAGAAAAGAAAAAPATLRGCVITRMGQHTRSA
jgi:hypothetical protein